MEHRKTDTERAIEIMQQLSEKIEGKEGNEKTVKRSMKKLISIFENPLFQALMDIQDYLNATIETEENASKVINERPAPPPVAPKPKFAVAEDHQKEKSKKKKKSKSREDLSPITPDEPDRVVSSRPEQFTFQPREPAPAPPPPAPVEPVPLDNDWEYIEINIIRSSTGFGFSIAGGFDAPIAENDFSILVSKVIPGGAAHLDGRLRLHDIIASVNGETMECVSHEEAVSALKRSGNELHLVVRRFRGQTMSPEAPSSQIGSYQSPQPAVFQVELQKRPSGGGLGFTIASDPEGGVSITKIVPNGVAEEDGRLQVTDKIIEVDGINIEYSTHEEAVNILKSTGNVVHLLVRQRDYSEFSSNQSPRPQFQENPNEGKSKKKKNKKGEMGSDSNIRESTDNPDTGVKKSKSHGGLFKKSKK